MIQVSGGPIPTYCQFNQNFLIMHTLTEMRFYQDWFDGHPEAISIFYPSYGMNYRGLNRATTNDKADDRIGVNNPLRESVSVKYRM